MINFFKSIFKLKIEFYEYYQWFNINSILNKQKRQRIIANRKMKKELKFIQ